MFTCTNCWRNNWVPWYLRRHESHVMSLYWNMFWACHYSDIIMSVMASQVTCVSIVCPTVCSGSDHRKHQSSASLAFASGIDRWPVDSQRASSAKNGSILMTSSCQMMYHCHTYVISTWINIKSKYICSEQYFLSQLVTAEKHLKSNTFRKTMKYSHYSGKCLST